MGFFTLWKRLLAILPDLADFRPLQTGPSFDLPGWKKTPKTGPKKYPKKSKWKSSLQILTIEVGRFWPLFSRGRKRPILPINPDLKTLPSELKNYSIMTKMLPTDLSDFKALQREYLLKTAQTWWKPLQNCSRMVKNRSKMPKKPDFCRKWRFLMIFAENDDFLMQNDEKWRFLLFFAENDENCSELGKTVLEL